MLNFVFILLNSAHATEDSPKNELSIEVGYLDGRSPKTWAFHNSTTYGLRGGYGINNWLTVIGSWHMSQTFTSFSDDHYDDYEYDSEVDYVYGSTDMPFSTRLRSHEIALGTKVDWSPSQRIHPYATAQILINRMGLNITESYLEDDPQVDIDGGGMGFGGIASGGVEYRTRSFSNGLQLASHFELGYGMSSRIQFDGMSNNEGDFSDVDVGDLALGGLYVRFGMGVRF
ncbi:MAG: hypothetical protein ACON4U_20250 [Myxococcota bacterium]